MEIPIQKSLILSEPWKYLIILDACRYEYFRQVAEQENYPGTLIPCHSPFTYTVEWYTRTWTDIDKSDIILVSGSPMAWTEFVEFLNRDFYRSVGSFKREDNWTPYGLPEAKSVLDDAEMQSLINPHCRIVIHLLPPHLPFIGPKGVAIMDALGGPERFMKGGLYPAIEQYTKRHHQEVVEAYKESIKYAMDDIMQCKWLDKTIVTSDHSEAMNPGAYCHVSGTVPWFRLELS